MSEELESYQEENENIQRRSENKKHYSEPSVIALGSMQRLTLAGSSPDSDSGVGQGTGEGV